MGHSWQQLEARAAGSRVWGKPPPRCSYPGLFREPGGSPGLWNQGGKQGAHGLHQASILLELPPQPHELTVPAPHT